MTDRRKLKPRAKWTEQMNADLLSCKREAVAMTLLEQPPLDDNGKKKGYIRIMSELWDAKGYGDLGLSSPNLRDQAARLEKTLEELRDRIVGGTDGYKFKSSRSKKRVYGCTNRSKFDRLYFFFRFLLLFS